MLTAAEEGSADIPVFGASAGLDSVILEDGAVSFVADDEGAHENSLLVVLFFGENLHVKVSYNLGWTEVGRSRSSR
jgi:hypothetical protein